MKKLKNIIILLFIIVVGLVGILFYINSKTAPESKEKLAYIKSDEWNGETYPLGAPKVFRAYQGELTGPNIGKSIDYFTNQLIPKYYELLKGASREEIETYFNENKKAILIDTGIDNFEDFYDLILSIKKLTSETLVLDSFKFDKENIINEEDYTNAILYITYKDNREIGFNTKIYNKMKKNSSSIEYTALQK